MLCLFQIYKSTKCNDMQQSGSCPRGPFCAFAHVERMLFPLPWAVPAPSSPPLNLCSGSGKGIAPGSRPCTGVLVCQQQALFPLKVPLPCPSGTGLKAWNFQGHETETTGTISLVGTSSPRKIKALFFLYPSWQISPAIPCHP